jgi:two-component sensor histidine kinase
MHPKGELIVVTCDAAKTESTLSASDNGQRKQEHTSVADVGLGTGMVATFARQLNAQVVTESGSQDTFISIIYHAAKAV